MESIRKKYLGKIKIYKVDVDYEKNISNKFKVKYMPTLVFISPKSKEYYKTVGYKTEREIKRFIRKKLKIK